MNTAVAYRISLVCNGGGGDTQQHSALAYLLVGRQHRYEAGLKRNQCMELHSSITFHEA